MLKHEDAKALVHAMFGSRRKSLRAELKMISGQVQLAYSEAFGDYPPEDESRSFWAYKLRAIADALVNRCGYCEGKGELSHSECVKCAGSGWVVEGGEDTDIISQIKSILSKFGVKDSQSYTKATICLDYQNELIGVSVTKRMLTFNEKSNSTTTNKHIPSG